MYLKSVLLISKNIQFKLGCYIREENVVCTHTYNYLFSLSNCFLIRNDESIIHMSADWWLIYVSYIIAQRLLYTFITTAI
jgi:hypothetical protein